MLYLPVAETIERVEFQLFLVEKSIKLHDALGPAGRSIDAHHRLDNDAARMVTWMGTTLSGPTLGRVRDTYQSVLQHMTGQVFPEDLAEILDFREAPGA